MTYAEIVELIDGTLASMATAAELHKRGAGLRHILEQLKLAVATVSR